MADLTIKPLIWARKDQVQHALRMPHLVACYAEKEAQNRADCMPLYDRSALDAAVAAALEQPAMEVLRKVEAERDGLLAELRQARKDAERWRLTGPAYTPQQIADACVAAEIPDSKCESLLLALQTDAAMQQEQQG